MLRAPTLAIAFVIAASPACGGASPGAGKTAGEESPGSGADRPGESGSATSDEPRPACRDEGCFDCGDGLCPLGFYCDETERAAPACSWEPDCMPEPSCGCLSGRIGAGCSCEDRSGAAFVTCG